MEPFSTLSVGEEATPSQPSVTLEVVSDDGASAMRLTFSEVVLGEGSRLILRSAEDGAQQVITAEKAEEWSGRSAIFNGPAIEVILERSKGDTEARYEIETKTVVPRLDVEERIEALEERTGTEERASQEAICGPEDDRQPSSDRRIGRIIPVGCTGWIGEGNKLLTAGHCVDPNNPSDMDLIEFNVPDSTAAGVIKYADPKDQYKIKTETIVYQDDGDGEEGNDWAVFEVEKNTETDRLPLEAQGGFFRLSNALPRGAVRITGFGLDSTPRSRNQTQQTHNSESISVISSQENDVVVSYIADTRPGNSGSPIISLPDEGGQSDTAFGIHTNGGCDEKKGTGNLGTGFQNNELWKAAVTITEEKEVAEQK
ncbi:trypsin-like serine peptidase [Paracoccus niistensis]|uniref:Trypsin-like serine peptidase n=2 Tax=Paracoccus niistensis TaxID=632935 RepID=A0ABV6I8M7_9RHOB